MLGLLVILRVPNLILSCSSIVLDPMHVSLMLTEVLC